MGHDIRGGRVAQGKRARRKAPPLIIFPLLARYSPPDVTLSFSSPRPPFTRRASEAHSPDDATLAALAHLLADLHPPRFDVYVLYDRELLDGGSGGGGGGVLRDGRRRSDRDTDDDNVDANATARAPSPPEFSRDESAARERLLSAWPRAGRARPSAACAARWLVGHTRADVLTT
jgi:hypothetical protein